MTVATRRTPWSYSEYKQFSNCPKQYYHLRVANDYVQSDTVHLSYGKRVHKALEEYVRDGTPLPEELNSLNWLTVELDGTLGGKVTEYEMAVTEDLQPCDFNDENRWWRGIADLIVFSSKRPGHASIFDYKTGKNTRFADTDQLYILGAALLSHFPQVKTVSGALLYTETGEAVTTDLMRREDGTWGIWRTRLLALDTAFKTGVWNARTSGLCGYCPVTSCIHNPTSR